MKKIKFEDVSYLYVGITLKDEYFTYKATLYSIEKKDLFIEIINDTISAGHWLNLTNAKPILRKLDSMTEEEAKYIYNLSGYDHIKKNCLQEVKNSYEIITSPIDIVQGIPKGWIWLLSKEFDLFNLIENGEAYELNL